MPEPGGPTFPSCTTQNTLPEPDCDNDAQGVLIVVERNSGDLVLERLICQPCVEREIRGWKMQPDGYCWTLIYQSFKGLVEQEEKLMPEPESTPGPWRVVKDYHGWAIRDADDWLIAVTPRKIEADRMAAAPDMLEALEWACSQLCQYPTWCGANHPVRKPKHDAIRATIAKARGETDA